MTDSSSSRPNSPHSSAGGGSEGPKTRVVSSSLRDRIAKFNNPDAIPLAPSNPYGGVSGPSSSSYARGGLVGNRLPSLDPKTAGVVPTTIGRTRVASGGLIGNRIPSGSSTSGRTVAGIGMGPPPSTGSPRSSSPTGSAASSSVAASSALSTDMDSRDSASVTTSLTSSPATSPDLQLPPQLLVSSLPDVDAGAMTPSSTMAEDGEDAFARSMPATPIATATTELPPPVHDLVPGNLTLASSGTGPATPSAPSLSSSLASQYDPASVDEEQDNLKDVSGVSTPIGTPRQAHRDLDDESSVADSNGKAEELDEKLKGLALDEDEGEGGKARENEDNGDSPLVVQRSPTPTLSESASQGGALFGAPLSATVSPEVLAAEEALKKAEDAATAAEDAVKPAEKAVTAAESSAVQSPAVPSFQSLPESVPATPVSASIKFDEEKTEEDASDKASQESTPTEATADSVSKSAKDTPAEKAAPAVPEPEAEKSEILDDEQDSDALAQSVELDRPRNSEDTLRPIESIRTGSDSAVATPIIPPADADSRSVKSLDRDATPQPPGDSDDERDVPALDDTSDIVSVGGGGPPSERGFENESSESTVAHDVSSNRSSMPPARASSELEFRYEEYADQFFRDQSGSGHDSATGAGAGAAAAAAATGVALGAATASAAHRSEETAAAASGSSGNTLQEPPARGNTGVSVEDEERRFPAVPTNNVDRASSSPHKPLQVHVEPSPYGPITDKQPKQPSSDPSSSEPTIISLNDTPAAVITIDPPASETDAPHTNFPAAPATDLPDPLTPSPSTLPSRTPTPPKRSSSLARTFPAVPDEQHPYVGVHLQEHRASTPTTPEHRLSADSERRPKRNSFTPRSPYLDDEDPGDFEPGEGWAVVTNWEPWRGSPTKQGQPLRPLSKPTSPVDKPLPSPISPDKPLPDTPAPPPQTPPGKGKNGKNGKRSSRKR